MFNGPVVAKLPWSMCQIMALTITRDNPAAASGMRNWYIRKTAGRIKPNPPNISSVPEVILRAFSRAGCMRARMQVALALDDRFAVPPHSTGDKCQEWDSNHHDRKGTHRVGASIAKLSCGSCRQDLAHGKPHHRDDS